MSAVDTLRAQRKQAPFRPLPEAPKMLTNVTFTEKDLHAHQPPPVQVPSPPPPISVLEQLNLTRPMVNTAALVTAAMAASLPTPTVNLRSYLQAEVRTYT